MLSKVWLGRRGISKVVLLLALLGQAQYSYGRVELAPCKNDYSPEQQIQLGQKAAQQVYKEMPVLPDSSPVTRYIQQLGSKLTAYAPGYKWPYNFHVANVTEINAFALPGGTVFVNLGTIQAAETEAELAGVMAHEISHVVLQHSVCNAAKEQKVGLIAGIGQIAAGVLLGGAVGQIASQGIGMTAGLGFLKMSRGAERQADLLGVGILYDAGYDPHGMAQFFEIIQSKYGAGGSQFMSDHPNPGNRTEYVSQEIATFVPRSHYVTTSPEFQDLKKVVGGMRAFTAKQVASGAWRGQNPNQTVPTGVNQSSGEAVAPSSPDLNTSGDWKTFRGSGFSMDLPQNWQSYRGQTGVMLTPASGIGRSADGGAGNVIYGVIADQYRPQGRMTIGAALDSLVSNITADNPGLTPGPQSTVTANGVSGQSVECNNPSGNNGKGEHDWVVAFGRQDGSLLYFVFVAPSPDFGTLQPTFNKMLQTLKLQ
ncbi:MAG: M48 family metallopeptidase [Acidobacteriota bacterium]|nr:M48 family metallopeptidase [Acidobacteriota bacterium]